MVLVLLAVVALILWVIFMRLEATSSGRDYEGRMIIFGVIGVISSIVTIGWMVGSYISYVNMRSDYDIIVRQYKESVQLYEDKAVLDVNDAAFTDFKYEGYQENIAAFVRELRYRVTRYNECYIQKKVVARNILFGWIISEPDADMHLIELRE